MLFLHLLDENPDLAPRVKRILESMQARGDRLCASLFSLSEILVSPCRRGVSSAVCEIKQFFLSTEVALLPFTPDCADLCARLRAELRLKALDALHLATAAVAGVDLILTHDRRLQGLHLAGIAFVAPMDVDLFQEGMRDSRGLHGLSARGGPVKPARRRQVQRIAPGADRAESPGSFPQPSRQLAGDAEHATLVGGVQPPADDHLAHPPRLSGAMLRPHDTDGLQQRRPGGNDALALGGGDLIRRYGR